MTHPRHTVPTIQNTRRKMIQPVMTTGAGTGWLLGRLRCTPSSRDRLNSSACLLRPKGSSNLTTPATQHGDHTRYARGSTSRAARFQIVPHADTDCWGVHDPRVRIASVLSSRVILPVTAGRLDTLKTVIAGLMFPGQESGTVTFGVTAHSPVRI